MSDDASDWTSTDEGETEQPKSKTTSSAVKQSKTRPVTSGLKPKLTPAPKLARIPSALETKTIVMIHCHLPSFSLLWVKRKEHI